MWARVVAAGLWACQDEAPAEPPSCAAVPWYRDADQDGYGAEPLGEACEAPPDAVATAGDCDDLKPDVHSTASEVCNRGIDDDCDPATVEDVVAGDTWWHDADGDGWGRRPAGTSCVRLAGTAERGGDCDDGDASVHPGLPEVCNGVDDDCDPATDEDVVDGDPRWQDADGDGWGGAPASPTCEPAPATAAVGGDCDDGEAAVHPGAAEACNGGRDDDCDGSTVEEIPSFWPDADADGFGDPGGSPVVGCEAPPGYADNADDCDDLDPGVHPDADEVCGGGDEDCDGTIDLDAVDVRSLWPDADVDGWGDRAVPVLACDGSAGLIAQGGDCDDADPEDHPAATESCGGTVDDCDHRTDPCRPTCVWVEEYRGNVVTAVRFDLDGTEVGRVPFCDIAVVAPDGRTFGWVRDSIRALDPGDCADLGMFATPFVPETVDIGDDTASALLVGAILGAPEFSPQGELWIPFGVEILSGAIQRFDGLTGAPLVPDQVGAFGDPAVAVAFDPARDAIVRTYEYEAVWRLTEAWDSVEVPDVHLTALEVAADGRLVARDEGTGDWYWRDPVTFASLGPFPERPGNVLALPDGRVLGTRTASDEVVSVAPDGTSTPWTAGLADSFSLVGLGPCPALEDTADTGP